ncbi:phytol kinase [Methanosarcina siciliae C2J]|uniref:Phytol kinase n=1 Tax=Methanosarcina siciliae C2J TaxID=1434118 RepID=A0A0E3LD01_9EURY|nr:diacylglycerol/polyprenol kinase family protein [Methanosarcina siciliae]AKB36411.1 phytol kinase [Methanosarcina siciliae C2J]
MAAGNTEGDRCEYQDENSSLKGEIGRQLIHLLTGVFFILLIYATGEKALWILLLLFAFYLATSFVILKNILPPSLSPFLCRWGRPEKQNIPLKGNILLLCGIIPSLVLFPEEIVYASIAIVGFGDSVSTVTGVTVGRHKLPYSEEKTVEGTLAGIIAAFLASLFFVTPAQAFVGSTGGMLLESIVDLQTVKELNSQAAFRFFLNDNFLIPIFSGLLMFITCLFQN